MDALTAAGTVPIIWAPIPIGDRRYVDGFIRSDAVRALWFG